MEVQYGSRAYQVCTVYNSTVDTFIFLKSFNKINEFIIIFYTASMHNTYLYICEKNRREMGTRIARRNYDIEQLCVVRFSPAFIR